MPIRYGIIGCGMMGQEHIKNILLLEDTEISVLVDPIEDMRNQARRLVGDNVLLFDEVNDYLVSADCDVFVIATPNDSHFCILSRVAACRKPVLVEKPLCTTLMDCQKVSKTFQATNVPVWVAMEYRYMPPFAELIRRVETGEAGRPVMMSIQEHRFPFLNKVGDWNRFSDRTGGTLVEKCCHFWDLMRFVLKSDPIRVFASASNDVNHLNEMYDGKTPDIVDNAFVIVDFENGCRGLLNLCMFSEGSYWQEIVSVVGTESRIDAMAPPPLRFLPVGEERNPAVEISRRQCKSIKRYDIPVDASILHAGDHCGATYYQHAKFLELVKGESKKPEVTLDDGMWAVAVGEAAEKSAACSEVVKVTIN